MIRDNGLDYPLAGVRHCECQLLLPFPFFIVLLPDGQPVPGPSALLHAAMDFVNGKESASKSKPTVAP